MKSQSHWIAIVLLSAVSLGLTACGGGNSSGSRTSGGSSGSSTSIGGTSGGTTDGVAAESILYSFSLISNGFPVGNDPSAALVQGSDGNFYGTTVVGGMYSDGTAFEITPGRIFTLLYSFGSQDLENHR